MSAVNVRMHGPTMAEVWKSTRVSELVGVDFVAGKNRVTLYGDRAGLRKVIAEALAQLDTLDTLDAVAHPDEADQ